MVDIKSISDELQKGDDGIWYSRDNLNVSYPQDGNERCFAVEDSSFWFHHRNKCIVSIVKSYPPENNGTIFDIGGGNGFVSLGLQKAGFDVVLVEPGPIGTSNARKRGIKNIICATTETAKFKKNSLPAVGLFDVIEHIEDDILFLKSIRVIMKREGYLYVTVPSYPFLWSMEDVSAGHFRRYTLKGITRVIKSSGFEILFSSYIFRFLPIPIFFLRSLPYKIGLRKKKGMLRNISRVHVVKSGPFGNLLNAVLELEIANLDNNRVMKFGGSCLIVAKAV
jgi:2-polyprenyl-3-methyl-5-hydroxy-6-metoxy-1,4-benzoquinol methylase